MNAAPVAFTDYAHLSFRQLWAMPTWRCIGDVYQGVGQRLLLDERAAESAALVLTATGWVHAFANEVAGLRALIRSLPLEPVPKFSAIPEAVWPAIEQRWSGLRYHLLDEWWIAPPDVTVESASTGPNGATSRILNAADVPTIIRYQPYIDEYGGPEYIHHRVRSGVAFGVDGDPGYELVAWMIEQDDGSIGLLRTRPAWRDRGFAGRVVIAMVRALAACGRPAVMHVDSANDASIRLARRIGFQRGGRVAWIREAE